jgi:hypothetical protein
MKSLRNIEIEQCEKYQHPDVVTAFFLKKNKRFYCLSSYVNVKQIFEQYSKKIEDNYALRGGI